MSSFGPLKNGCEELGQRSETVLCGDLHLDSLTVSSWNVEKWIPFCVCGDLHLDRTHDFQSEQLEVDQLLPFLASGAYYSMWLHQFHVSVPSMLGIIIMKRWQKMLDTWFQRHCHHQGNWVSDAQTVLIYVLLESVSVRISKLNHSFSLQSPFLASVLCCQIANTMQSGLNGVVPSGNVFSTWLPCRGHLT